MMGEVDQSRRRRNVCWRLAALVAVLVALGPVALTLAPAGAAHEWETVAPMPTPRRALSAATGADGRIYAIGGSQNNQNTNLDTVERYDPHTNTWTTVAPMPTRRSNLAATVAPCPATAPAPVAGECIYAIGGWGSDERVVEVYHPATDTWLSSARPGDGVARMPTGRSSFAVATAACPGRAGTCVYLIGGHALVTINRVEAYDPSTNSWETVAPMLTPRAGLAAATGRDGNIYAIGGRKDLPSSEVLASVERFSPDLGVWVPVDSMDKARSDHAAVTGGMGASMPSAGCPRSEGYAGAFMTASRRTKWRPTAGFQSHRSPLLGPSWRRAPTDMVASMPSEV